jgi:hypothetical protein
MSTTDIDERAAEWDAEDRSERRLFWRSVAITVVVGIAVAARGVLG